MNLENAGPECVGSKVLLRSDDGRSLVETVEMFIQGPRGRLIIFQAYHPDGYAERLDAQCRTIRAFVKTQLELDKDE